MAIDRNTLVDVPGTAYVGKDCSVYVKDKNVYDPVKRYNIVKHTVIGRSVGNGKMYPNSNYKARYPALYEQFSGQKLRRHTLKAGVYVATLAVSQRNGLYNALTESFGIGNANMMLDFSMYSIVHQTCVSEQYAVSMQDQMIFSGSLWSPSRLSQFFGGEFTEQRMSEFKKLWAGCCMKSGVEDVWLAIDGSNNDCRVADIPVPHYSGLFKSLPQRRSVVRGCVFGGLPHSLCDPSDALLDIIAFMGRGHMDICDFHI